MKDEKDIVILLSFHPSSFRLHPLFVVLAEGFDLDINARREV